MPREQEHTNSIRKHAPISTHMLIRIRVFFDLPHVHIHIYAPHVGVQCYVTGEHAVQTFVYPSLYQTSLDCA